MDTSQAIPLFVCMLALGMGGCGSEALDQLPEEGDALTEDSQLPEEADELVEDTQLLEEGDELTEDSQLPEEADELVEDSQLPQEGDGLTGGSEALSLAVTSFPTPAQFQARFSSLLQAMSPWGLGSYFEDLLMAARVTKNPEYTRLLIENGLELTKRTSYATNVVDSFTGRKGYVLLTSAYTCGRPAAFIVHHGYIWSPIVAGIREYLAKTGTAIDPALRFGIVKILSVSMQGLNYFDRYKAQVGGRQVYTVAKYPYSCESMNDDNAHVGEVVPANFAAASGELALELVRVFSLPPGVLKAVSDGYKKKRKVYLKKQTANLMVAVASLKPFLRVTSSGSVIWKYMPEGRPEDTSHGSMVVRFLATANQMRVISTSTLRGVAKTFHSTYSTGPSSVYSHIEPYLSGGNDVRTRGETEFVNGLARWVHLARYDCKIYSQVNAIQNFQKADGSYPYRNSKTGYLLLLYKGVCNSR